MMDMNFCQNDWKKPKTGTIRSNNIKMMMIVPREQRIERYILPSSLDFSFHHGRQMTVLFWENVPQLMPLLCQPRSSLLPPKRWATYLDRNYYFKREEFYQRVPKNGVYRYLNLCAKITY